MNPVEILLHDCVNNCCKIERESNSENKARDRCHAEVNVRGGKILTNKGMGKKSHQYHKQLHLSVCTHHKYSIWILVFNCTCLLYSAAACQVVLAVTELLDINRICQKIFWMYFIGVGASPALARQLLT